MESSDRTDKEGSSFSQDRLALRAYLEKESLLHLDKIFPDYISLDYFKTVTDDDLEHDFHIKDPKLRLEIMKAVIKCRDDDNNSGNEHEEVSLVNSRQYLMCANLTSTLLMLNI